MWFSAHRFGTEAGMLTSGGAEVEGDGPALLLLFFHLRYPTTTCKTRNSCS